jgi:hypothetical protein
MAETTAITVYIKDLDILDAEIEQAAKEKYGTDFNIYDRSFRSELIGRRKALIHDCVSRSKYNRKKK